MRGADLATETKEAYVGLGRARSAPRQRGAAVAPGFASIPAFVAISCLALLLRTASSAQEPVTVSNDTHDVQIVRVALTDSLHNGMVQPPTADEAFLLVYLETADPCFDPTRNAACFDADRDELETVAWACGEVEITPDDQHPADGGGLLNGELACSYVVPVATGALVLRLRGYPEINVEPTG